MIRDQGLSIVSLCRGGSFPPLGRLTARRPSMTTARAIAEAHALGAPLIVLVCGAVPGQPLYRSRASRSSTASPPSCWTARPPT